MAEVQFWRMRRMLEESYPVTCLSQTPEDKGSMSPVSFHGSGMCPESLLDCD